MELYAKRGFESTAVADIAERAGLTERTFYRHFADKREVLFYGAGALQEFLVGAVEKAPSSSAPIEVIVSALVEAATSVFEERREFARRRQAIIVANVELLERELVKLATLASALADALRQRGVPDPVASLAAEAGISLFKVAFQRWVDDSGKKTLAHFIRESSSQMKAVTAGRRPAPR